MGCLVYRNVAVLTGDSKRSSSSRAAGIVFAEAVFPVASRDEAVEERGAGVRALGGDEVRHVLGQGVRGRVDEARLSGGEQLGGPAL
jgi:hypothetical protein